MQPHERPGDGSAGPPESDSTIGAPGPERNILIGKEVVPVQSGTQTIVAEVFTMTLAKETIQLLPLKTWSQLDVFKWRARGLLPATPAGLEIALDHVKVGDQTVSTWDADGCLKLEQAFNEWLELENQALEAAKQKAQALTIQPLASAPDPDIAHFKIEVDESGRGRLKCLEGNEMVKEVGLNPLGFKALIDQGLMRQPGGLKIGALHDWVELDGELFRFRDGEETIRKFEQALNDRYAPRPDGDSTPDIIVMPNPASPTGFDVQFPAMPNGLTEIRRQHLTEEAVELLRDQRRCRVLRKGTIAKLAPPHLIFKRATADGGERNLAPRPDNVVEAPSDDGQTKIIDLSQPVNLLELGARELTAVLNHPAVNRRARLAQTAGAR